MNTTIALSQDDGLLQETAARLVKTLGVEMAIFICRSNYWHGILKLIEGQTETSTVDDQASGQEEPIRLHSLPRQAVRVDRDDAYVREIAIAA